MSAAVLLTASISDKSAEKTLTATPNGERGAASSLSFSSSLATSKTLAPCLAKALAIPRPIPALPPVITIRLCDNINTSKELRPNRDREGPRGLPPPTPPDIRVTSPAVRPMQAGPSAPQPACLLPACQPCVHPRGRASPDPSPEAIAPLHPRPPLLSTVQAFRTLARAYDAVC
jgi:hypothetical protein